jgi:hypothetical protein
VLVVTTKAAEVDVSPMEYIDTSAPADATPALSAPAAIASTYDGNVQSRTEVVTQQVFIRRSKRKRLAEAGNGEALAVGSKHAKR